MGHDRVLQLHAGDPLSAALHQIFRAIDDLNVALRVDGHDVAGAEPTVLKRLLAAWIVVIAADDPRSADL